MSTNNKNEGQNSNDSNSEQNSQSKPHITTSHGKSPIGGSDSLEDYDDTIMPDGEDSREASDRRNGTPEPGDEKQSSSEGR